MHSKISGHIQRLLPWMASAILALGSGCVKLVDPGPGEDPFPGVKKCLRFHTDSWDKDLIARGSAGADEYMHRMIPVWRQFVGWGECVFELPNEPDCNSQLGLVSLREFTIRCIELAEQAGFKVVVFNLAEGNPGDDGTHNEDIARRKMQMLSTAAARAIQGGHYLGFHGYWRPPFESPTSQWHCLRYRKNLRYLAEDGVDVRRARVILTEAGIDGGVSDREHPPVKGTGWKTHSPSVVAYARDVAMFNRELEFDPRVDVAFLFAWGFYDPWEDFDHDESAAEVIMQELERTALPEPARIEVDWTGNCPNFCERYGYKPRYIVVHGTEGGLQATLDRFRNPAEKASSHVVIDSDGTKYRVVDDKYAAWTNGKSRIPGLEGSDSLVWGTAVANLASLTVELVYPKDPASPEYPPEQLESLRGQLLEWMVEDDIPVEHIHRHGDVLPEKRSDPRNLSIGTIRALVGGPETPPLPDTPAEDEPPAEGYLPESWPATPEKLRYGIEELKRKVEQVRATYADVVQPILEGIDEYHGSLIKLAYEVERQYK